MIGLPAGTRIWITAGVTDLRRGFTGLSGMVQTALQENPFSGHVFVFRGRRGDLIKMLWWDGDGLQKQEAPCVEFNFLMVSIG
jgi:transposase